MKTKNTTIVASCLLACVSTTFGTPGYDDLSLGSTYYPGGSTASESVSMLFRDFQWWDGTWTSGGEATVGNGGWACGTTHELGLNNINVIFDYVGSVGSSTDVSFDFGEHGGNINVAINGDAYNTDNFIDLHGLVIGGTTFNVVSGGYGHDCGRVEISGLVHKLRVGGQELWLDNITSTPNDPCQYGYEDLAGIAVGTPGDTFTTDGIDFYVAGFQWWGGTWTYGGLMKVDTTGLACATGNELWVNNCTVVHDFAASTGPMDNVSIQFGEYGGNVNVEINGDFRNAHNFIDLDGSVIGGVLVSIPYGGLGNDCGTMVLTGTVSTLGIGGQELWLDCLEGDSNGNQSKPGDTNGDGTVDVMDLLAVIQAWGACSGDCPADLNGDGTVDVMDLLMVLENWG
ncbi:MAG: dockerin type I domain-containing protein [Phycisphaerales bacterium]|jgi:hypothetical protein|nr:dockerin type I domain-containing protein [Phycisphaerales bacterium]